MHKIYNKSVRCLLQKQRLKHKSRYQCKQWQEIFLQPNDSCTMPINLTSRFTPSESMYFGNKKLSLCSEQIQQSMRKWDKDPHFCGFLIQNSVFTLALYLLHPNQYIPTQYTPIEIYLPSFYKTNIQEIKNVKA